MFSKGDSNRINLAISPNKTNSTVSIHGDNLENDSRYTLKKSKKSFEYKDKDEKYKIRDFKNNKNIIKEEEKEFYKENKDRKNMPNMISINRNNLDINYCNTNEKKIKDIFPQKKQPPNISPISDFGLSFNKNKEENSIKMEFISTKNNIPTNISNKQFNQGILKKSPLFSLISLNLNLKFFY